MNALIARLRSAWRGLRRGSQLDAAMQQEMRFHIESETDRLVREGGVEPDEARRLAHIAFGGVEKYKEQARDSRRFRWLDVLSLDARLGIRMLVKHRGLTLVGGVAMAVAIAVGATFFEVFAQLLNPALPLDEGDRVVSLQYATQTAGSAERRVLHDFAAWRHSLRSVEHLGAFRTAEHNLVTGRPPYASIEVAEITASAFIITRTPPLIGRYLVPGDEDPGAPAVVVIGHQAWSSHFARDPQVIGRTLDLAGAPFTIVGVMPEGYRFPVNHQYWIPLRENPLDHARLHGPSLFLFGRLAPGVTLEAAQAELTTVGQQTAAAYPDLYQRLRPLVLPYTREHVGLTSPYTLWVVRLAQLFVGALTLVVAVNLAILVYARTVTRAGEIAVRTALGASRGRVLVQLFVESLALALLGAGAGLVLAQVALGRLNALLGSFGTVAYWIDLKLSLATIVYAVALAVVAAWIMGVLPGLKATGRRVYANLRELDGRSGARLGPLWTMLVVAQVAIAVAVLPLAVYTAWQVVRMGVAGPEIAAAQFVVGVVALSDDAATIDAARIAARQAELTGRLQAEPGVSAVTFSSGIPGFAPGRLVRFEGSNGIRHPNMDLGTDSLDVALDLFRAYGAQILAGREFTSADLGATRAVIVNRAFADALLHPGAAIGVRFRYVAPYERRGTSPDAVYEIIGVVRDFPGFPPEPGSDGDPTVYHPAAPGDVHPLALSVRFSGSIPDGFLDRFRAIAAEVDPALQMRRVLPLAGFYDQLRSFWRNFAWGISLLTLSVLMLSAAGIYALMSFTVALRTREIAIRSALGAAPKRLVIGIFRRATSQLGLGLLVGSVLSAGVFQNTDLGWSRAAAVTVVVAVLMVVVGLMAAFGPARRALNIHASEALRADT